MTSKPHTTLHINCLAEQKQAWLLSARIAGMSFEQWVASTLNAATIDAAPPTLNGLSERARVCLLGEGIKTALQAKIAIASGLDIAKISNAGNSVKNEVLAWLKNN